MRLKRKTSKKRLRRAIVNMSQWIKQNRNKFPLREIWKTISSKMRGHFSYFGISDNFPSLEKFDNEVKNQLFIWLNKRSQRKSFTWENFKRYTVKYPLPKPKIRISMFSLYAKN